MEECIGKKIYNDEMKSTPDIEEVKEKINRIDEDEVREIIQEVPKGKAAGDDGICAEILRNLGEKEISSITELINKIYETGDLPIDFIKSVFIPIPKVSKAMERNENRAISLTAHAAKILLKIIKKKMTQKIESKVSESQLGFIKGKVQGKQSTSHGI